MGEARNPPAFPFKRGGIYDDSEGMSLRDYLAAAALPAIITAACSGTHTPGANLEGATTEERIAHDAYKIADAMMKERT